MSAGSATFPATVVIGCLKFMRAHLSTITQYGVILVESSTSFLYQGHCSTTAKMIKSPERRATTTPTTLPGATTTFSMLKIDAVVETRPRNYGSVRCKTCHDDSWTN